MISKTASDFIRMSTTFPETVSLWQKHPRHARMDHSQQPCAHWNRADLSGARKSQRQSRRTDLGNLPRHADRTSRTGRGLFHHSRRSSSAVHSTDGQTHNGHCFARRFDHGQMVSGTSPGKFPVHPLPRNLRNHAGV